MANMSPEDVRDLYMQLAKDRGPLLAQWKLITELADNSIVIPLMKQDKAERAAVVNLFNPALDGMATRAASVQPDQEWPTTRQGIDAAEATARSRRQAGLGWWDMNKMTIIDYQRFRYHFAYGSSPVSIMPVGESKRDMREIPHWRIHNPMCSFPAPTSNHLDMEPEYAIFTSQRTRSWLKNNYPDALRRVGGYSGDRPGDRAHDSDVFEVLEYHDSDEILLVLCGRKPQHGLWTPGGTITPGAAALLERWQNLANIPLIIFAGRITLGRIAGQFDQMVPAYFKAAKLDSMNYLALTHQIYPERWVQSHPGDPQAPDIIVEADPERGIIGEIAHGSIQTIGPGISAAQMIEGAIDRSERAQRIAGPLPAEMQGEGASNVRTAIRGQALEGAATDTVLQEAHEIFQVSKELELQRAVAVQKGWFGDKKTNFYVSRNGKTSRWPDYVPNETFETDEVYVKYAVTGADARALPTILGQLVNTGINSQHTARMMSPTVEDVVAEEKQLDVEGLRLALLKGLEAQAQQGALGPDQIAMITKLRYGSDKSIEEVVLQVHDEYQKKQAAAAQAQPGSAETQPGLNSGGGPAQPGMQPQGGPPGGSPISAGPPNLAALLANLKGGGAPPGSTGVPGPPPQEQQQPQLVGQ